MNLISFGQIQPTAIWWIRVVIIQAALVLAANAEPPAAGVRCGGARVTIVETAPKAFLAASGNFGIMVTYDNTVSAAQRVVIQQAVNEWSAMLQSRGVNPASYPVTIRYAALGGRIGSTGVNIRASGELVSADTAFEANLTWFEDPTPMDDSEFNGATPPPAGYDLLTVARHELGHAFGWIDNSRVQSLIANNVFDANRLNIGMTAGDSQHSDPVLHTNDLMLPSIGASERRPIRLYPNGALIARAYEQQIPMHFVDPTYGGNETGTAWQPWRTFFRGAELAPPNVPLLLAPTTHATLRNHNHSIPRTIYTARDGATVLGLNFP